MYKYVADFISAAKYSLKCPYTMSPQFIVVHNTANDAGAVNEIAFMKNSDAQTSFHFAIDDAEVRQGLPLNRNAWHAGDGENGRGNRRGIAVEICYSASGGEKFKKAEENAAKYIASLLKEYGWGIDRVKKHQDFSGKYCPHRTLDMGWERFLKLIDKYMSEDIKTEELTQINDIVWELSSKGIITNKDLWLSKLELDEEAYWLARKTANYIREKN